VLLKGNTQEHFFTGSQARAGQNLFAISKSLQRKSHFVVTFLDMSHIASISSSYQTVVLGPSLTGFGKRPSLTPFHHEVFEIGMRPGQSGVPIIIFSLKKRLAIINFLLYVL
jgi:hypothetical protein